MFPAVAGVRPETSRSIKPRERDLGDLRLFVLVRILTRPTNHPRHAACASNYESKPVRPHFFGDRNVSHSRDPATDPVIRSGSWNLSIALEMTAGAERNFL